jgi:uncharacterized membrane protein YhaH (DUF805 family)
MMPILEGLKEVHAYHYLHRDIKPANILLRANQTPVLIDFGASKVTSGEVSKSITSILTEGYAPPEQYSTDAKKQGPFSDLYALAAVMHKMITGETPPGAQTRNYALLSDEMDPYLPLLERNLQQHYDSHFLGAIDTALLLDARQRPQSVQEFQAMIYGRSEPVVTVSAEPTEVLKPVDSIPSQSDCFFSFDGRIGRGRYWISSLVAIMILVAGMIIFEYGLKSEARKPGSIIVLLALGTSIWVWVAAQAKRWRDLDQSGWWTLTSFIPYANILVWFLLGIAPGVGGTARNDAKLPRYLPEAIDVESEAVDTYADTMVQNDTEPTYPGVDSVTLKGEADRVPSIVLYRDEEVVVGRASQADVAIADKYISKRHVSLYLDERGRVVARDLHSTNGTYLAGKKLEPDVSYVLREGDRLILGSEDVVFRL